MAVDTFTIAAVGDDGYAGTSNNNGSNVSATDTTNNFVMHSGDTDAYWATFLQFDTSSLAGATISSATLKLYVNSKADPNTLSIEGFYYDYGGTINSTLGGTVNTGALPARLTGEVQAFNAVTVSSLTTTAVNDFALLNPDSNINKSGYTRFAIGYTTSLNINHGNNNVQFAGKSSGSDSNIAQLEITYTGGKKQTLFFSMF